MYITITPQKMGDYYATSVADFVAYLEKENEGKSLDDIEPFFNQYGDHMSTKQVIYEIDNNTAKLKKKEPKFYAITLNPSSYELKHLKNHSEALKQYTRDVMKCYAAAFNREINGRPIRVEDLKYFAKIEHERSYKGTDKAIQENAPYYKEIVALKNEIQQINDGSLVGNSQLKIKRVKQLEKEAPHILDGQIIKQGMAKQGVQSHIHIIVSRKDQSNQYSLSPGSQYKASQVVMNGKIVKRGFDRDGFFKASERTFDTLFTYRRNYVETYQARKTFVKQPQLYYASILDLPTSEKAVALKMLGKAGLQGPLMSIPTNKVQLLVKAIKQLKRGMGKAIESSSIGL